MQLFLKRISGLMSEQQARELCSLWLVAVSIFFRSVAHNSDLSERHTHKTLEMTFIGLSVKPELTIRLLVVLFS